MALVCSFLHLPDVREREAKKWSRIGSIRWPNRVAEMKTIAFPDPVLVRIATKLQY